MKIKVLQGMVSDGKHLYSFSAQSPGPPLFRPPFPNSGTNSVLVNANHRKEGQAPKRYQ
jgi:hypothetical protein